MKRTAARVRLTPELLEQLDKAAVEQGLGLSSERLLAEGVTLAIERHENQHRAQLSPQIARKLLSLLRADEDQKLSGAVKDFVGDGATLVFGDKRLRLPERIVKKLIAAGEFPLPRGRQLLIERGASLVLEKKEKPKRPQNQPHTREQIKLNLLLWKETLESLETPHPERAAIELCRQLAGCEFCFAQEMDLENYIADMRITSALEKDPSGSRCRAVTDFFGVPRRNASKLLRQAKGMNLTTYRESLGEPKNGRARQECAA